MLEIQLQALSKEVGSAQIKESVEKIWRDMRKNKKDNVMEIEEKGTQALKPTSKSEEKEKGKIMQVNLTQGKMEVQ